MKRLLFAVLMAMLSVNFSFAGDLEDGIAAFDLKNYEKALPLLQTEADKGVAKAQGLIARMYAQGWGISRDYGEALKWAKLAAAQGDTAGQNVVGVIYQNGFGVTKDPTEAFKWFRLAADQNFALAQINIGLAYQIGVGVTRDYREALKWYRLAADQGDDGGKALLGMLYLNGQGDQKDDEKAVLLIRQSAASKSPLGMYELGKLMLVGRAMARDVNEGETLLKRAAASLPGLKDSVELMVRTTAELDQWREGLSRLSCDGFACAFKEGRYRKQLKEHNETMMWVELAAMTLDVGSRTDLMYFYLGRASEGIGDLPQALIYYNLAMNPKQFGRRCDGGIINNCDGVVLPRDALDRRNIVSIAIQEKIKRDAEHFALTKNNRKAAEAAEAVLLASEKEALKLKELAQSFVEIRKKAEEGSSEAQYRVSQMYFAGIGTTTDETAGLIWLTKAAQQGYADAQYGLGERFRTGVSVAQDNVKAEMWFRKAVQQGHDDTGGGLAALLADKQARADAAADAAKKRAAAAADAAKERAAAAAALEKKEEEERADLARKIKLENAAKLKSL